MFNGKLVFKEVLVASVLFLHRYGNNIQTYSGFNIYDIPYHIYDITWSFSSYVLRCL